MKNNTNSRKEYFKKYYQNNKEKYYKKDRITKISKPLIQGLKIEHKKVIITFD